MIEETKVQTELECCGHCGSTAFMEVGFDVYECEDDGYVEETQYLCDDCRKMSFKQIVSYRDNVAIEFNPKWNGKSLPEQLKEFIHNIDKMWKFDVKPTSEALLTLLEEGRFFDGKDVSEEAKKRTAEECARSLLIFEDISKQIEGNKDESA